MVLWSSQYTARVVILVRSWISEVRIIFHMNEALSDLSSQEPSKFIDKIYFKKNYRMFLSQPIIHNSPNFITGNLQAMKSITLHVQ